MSRIIRTFAVFQDGSNILRWATVIAQHIVWAIFMPLRYPHTAVSLREIKPFGGYHLGTAQATPLFVYVMKYFEEDKDALVSAINRINF